MKKYFAALFLLTLSACNLFLYQQDVMNIAGYDNQPPVLNLEGSLTNLNIDMPVQLTITGVSGDNFDKLAVWMSHNEEPFAVVSSNAEWSVNVYLPGAIHRFRFFVTDRLEHSSSTQTVWLADRAIYVAPDGNDAYPGFAIFGSYEINPLFTIEAAVAKALDLNFDKICIAEGVYSNGAGLGWSTRVSNGIYLEGNTGLLFSGGWSGDFSVRTNVSHFMGLGLKHIVDARSVTNIGFENLVFRNVESGEMIEDGGGARLSYFRNVSFSNCSFVSNHLNAVSGGGIYAEYGEELYVIDGYFYNNTNFASGGGIYLASCSDVDIFAGLIANASQNDGGGFAAAMCSNLEFNGSCLTNFAAQGGGIAIAYSEGIALKGTFISNMGSSQGAAIYIGLSTNIVIEAQVNNNLADYGGYIYSTGCIGMMMNSTVMDCRAYTSGSAVYLSGGSNCTILGNYSGNNGMSSSTGSVMYIANVPDLAIYKAIFTNENAGTIIYFPNGIMLPTDIEDNTFSGNINTYAIIDETNSSGHILLANVFFTNLLTSTYYDLSSGGAPPETYEYTNINSPGYTGAISDSTNNILAVFP